MTIYVGIDPGPCATAICVLPCGNNLPPRGNKVPNAAIINWLHEHQMPGMDIVIEMIASYGMPVGAEVFETCVWIGRFLAAAPWAARLTRIQVKSHICHSAKANDSNIRQALIDRWGGKDKAIGNKKNPGPLYGFAGDMWAALAVAVTASETTERYKAP